MLASCDELLDPGPPSHIAVSAAYRSETVEPVAHTAALVDDEATVSKDAPVLAGRRAGGESDQMSEAMAGRAEDAALVARALAGDQTAFAQLEARTTRALRGFFAPRVGRFDEETQKYIVNRQLVDDLIQKTWIELWPQLATYDPSRARFATFATNWAGFIVKRHRASAEYRGIEMPVDVAVGGEPDASGGDSFDRLPVQDDAGYPAPEDPVDVDVYDDLMSLIFATASPPHQLLAMGFVKGLEWKPGGVVAELSNIPLRTLEERFEADYLEQSEIPPERITPAFARLRARFKLRFADAVRDPVTLKTYPALHERIVGETTLADYFTDDPAPDVTQWWHAVRRRVIAEIERRATGPLAELLRQTQRHSKNKKKGA